jgi:ABC-2 type transport system permease protein
MAKYHCKMSFVIILLFIAVSIIVSDSLFFCAYPMLAAMMVPLTLLSYDERNRWERNSATMPYTRSQLVSVKYLDMLILLVGCLILVGIAQGVRMLRTGNGIQWENLGILLVALLGIGMLSPCFLLPIVFRLGVEKGRLWYYVFLVGFFIAVSAVANILPEFHLSEMKGIWLLLGGVLLAVIVLLISWNLSIHFYERREL